jgi:hypothetical protein
VVDGMRSNLNDIYHNVHEALVRLDRKWKRTDSEPQLPTCEEVKTMIDNMIQTIEESSNSILVESGGILIKRTDDYIDTYVHCGGFK